MKFLLMALLCAAMAPMLQATELKLGAITKTQDGNLLATNLQGNRFNYQVMAVITTSDVVSVEKRSNNLGETYYLLKLDEEAQAALNKIQSELFETDPTNHVLLIARGQQLGKSDLGTSYTPPDQSGPVPVGMTLEKTESNAEVFEEVFAEVKDKMDQASE